jgi:CDGSH-type Zn-finger protein/uncharacterized Fe-S cluster protein YjdI
MLATTAAPVALSAKADAPHSPGFVHARADPKTSLAKNGDIEIAFESKRCIHARYCVAWLPNVFRPGKTPWMDPDADTAEEIAAVVRNCASGALQYHRFDGGDQEKAPASNTVMVRENGPLAFRADLLLDGNPIGNRATMCRCGKTKNAPYCDSSHKDGFQATGEPESVDDPGNKNYFAFVDAPNGPLEVEQVADGPLNVTGALQIQSGTGRKIDTTNSVALCRCGRSANKPFCDGSHADKT